MSATALIFDLSTSSLASRFGDNTAGIEKYCKEIGLVAGFVNALSTFHRVMVLGAEPAVAQKYKLLGLADSPVTALDLSAQVISKAAAILGRESLHAALAKVVPKKSAAFEYAQSLQRAYCFIRRMRKEAKVDESFHSRTIIVNFTSNVKIGTTELMTVFFSFQHHHEVIDVLDLSGVVNPTLQQGCDITGGKYLVMEELPSTLLGCLARNFFISNALSSLLPSVSEQEVDYRYPCFCHDRLVDLGYVCARCIAVHCRPYMQCRRCKAPFVPQTTIDDILADIPAEELENRNDDERAMSDYKRRVMLNIEQDMRTAVFPVKKQRTNAMPPPPPPATNGTSEA